MGFRVVPEAGDWRVTGTLHEGTSTLQAWTVTDPANGGYPNFKGKPEFRAAVAGWMKRRYGVEIDPDTEVQPLIGSKEGIAHLPFAFVEPGVTLDSRTVVPGYLE